ncbi:MAG: A24 family peptidase [Gammaproteobacteria bacterium]|nr:A24 family peptidase [Gammaproteobacteria bacterium]
MDSLLLALETSPAFWITACTLLGLLVGSFLNVVIYRLPVILEREWQGQAREILELAPEEDQETFNLVTPRSRCRECDAPITAAQNVPVFSYLFLAGKCRHCRAPISVRYPLIELLTGFLTGFTAWYFGFSFEAVGGFLLVWLLIAMTFIDFDTQLLPDNLTLPLLWLGLLFSLGGAFATPTEAIIGAAAGYLSLWSIYHAFRLLTGKEGMGYGDFKLYAALGAWMGWKVLPMIILLSAGAGAIIGGAMILLAGHERQVPIPFGPFLAIAGLIAFFYGDNILSWYLGLYARP